MLSLEEVLPLLNFMFPFQKLDANKDGLLDLPEFRKIAAPKLQGKPPEEVKKSRKEAKRIFEKLEPIALHLTCARSQT